jgi:integrase
MNVTKKTKDMQRADVIRFAAKFASVQEVTRPEVRRWISSLMAADTPLTPKTVQRILSALRGYWRYLQSVSVAGETDEPFDKLDVARQGGRATEDKRKPFKSADVVQMLNAAITKEDEELADVIRLAMWSGARIEELASLKVQNVAADHFTVADAKTTAGVREVPIHAALAQTMTRLIDGRTTGHVLATLKPNKYGDRSNAVGKRFGRLARKQGFGPAYVFHSIRKTVATQLENAGVAEGIAADILGHEKPTMTYGLYSGGATLALKAEAIAKLAY